MVSRFPIKTRLPDFYGIVSMLRRACGFPRQRRDAVSARNHRGHHQAGLLNLESDCMAGIFLDQQGFHIVNHHIVVKGGLHHIHQLFSVQIGPNGFSFSPSHCVILSALPSSAPVGRFRWTGLPARFGFRRSRSFPWLPPLSASHTYQDCLCNTPCNGSG